MYSHVLCILQILTPLYSLVVNYPTLCIYMLTASGLPSKVVVFFKKVIFTMLYAYVSLLCVFCFLFYSIACCIVPDEALLSETCRASLNRFFCYFLSRIHYSRDHPCLVFSLFFYEKSMYELINYYFLYLHHCLGSISDHKRL